jgi:hypothetical protein
MNDELGQSSKVLEDPILGQGLRSFDRQRKEEDSGEQ